MILLHLALAMAAVIILGRLLGWLFAAVNEPPVIGEIVAGILLGPSLLGRLSPDAYAVLLPPAIVPPLSLIAQFGVAAYMFVVGLELNVARVRWRARATIAISNVGIIVPFLLGSVLAIYLYPRLSAPDVRFASFALFIGTAMSITAFPVLARILTDRQMTHTTIGAIALTCAAVDDVSAWCLLALVVGVAKADIGSAWIVAAATIAYGLFMLFVARPIMVRLVARDDRPTAALVAMTWAGAALSAWATEWIGVHAIFGAFVFGAIIPHDSALAALCIRWLKQPVSLFLLPAFFALAGMRTRIDLLSGASDWLLCALIILVASAGKFGGCFAAARGAGLSFRESTVLGFLMNTRGLMELIVLNIGLDLGVISPRLFTMMVLMALATTLTATPIVDALPLPEETEAAEGTGSHGDTKPRRNTKKTA